jgi:hypothetical protein
MTLEQNAVKQTQFDQFYTTLAEQYRTLFQTPKYAMAAARYTPEDLARKMTCGLAAGTADKDGEGIIKTCKALGISHTYKAIRAYL